MQGLTKAQALKIIAKLQEPGFVPFLNVASVLCDVPRVVAEQAYQRGMAATGTDLEKVFAAAVEKCKAKFCAEALAVINDPTITRSGEARARQLMNLMGKLDRVTFGQSIPKAPPLAAMPSDPVPETLKGEAADLATALEQLEKKEG